MSNFRIFRTPQSTKAERQRAGCLLLFVFLAVLIFSPDFRFWVRSLVEYPFHYKEYKHFGIRIPGGYKVHGIDVSKWQSRVDWARVKAMKVGKVRISFAFIKATEGSWMEDPQFDRNWINAKKNGIIRGAYHYFLPNISAKDQALKFTKTVKLRSGDLPPVVDVEEENGMTAAQIRMYTKEFLNLLQKHYKVKPILYTNKDFYKRFFAKNEAFKDYLFWIAHYHVADLEMPDDGNWHFWQHSDRGNVNGINEPVDFNVFNGDSIKLSKLCIP
ncbi:MAG: glycoside hydrolase family 25 protein [Lewinellaceae bacterium]|nr:glycoside hydrolase family 25 protein [Saprospiraceae bacterium]MCB9345023.1 glycoside hydrolase family 25 protein [Lewinellaceae bacterium]